MKVCSVPMCGKDSFNRPDLSYFSLPRDINIRDEWLEVLGVKTTHRGQNLSICELHFRDLDFKAGKKELKRHAIPVLRLGSGKADPVGSDDEFIADGSDSEPEIVEITQHKVTSTSANKKKQPMEKKIQQEPIAEMECETGRRPCRRAALVAAKKIFNTVRNYGVKDDDPEDPPATPTTPTVKTPITPRPYARQKKQVDVDLAMDCKEEALSITQAEFLCEAQNQYNLAMKNLRELTACKVRIIQIGMEPVNFNVPSNVFAQNGSSAVGVKNPKNNKVQPKSTVARVLPMLLSKASPKSKTPIIYL